MTEPKGMIYLRAGGAERFRKDTSKIFRKRDNPTLLEIDGKLNRYPVIPAQNFNQRAQALVAIITLCAQWLDAKKTKIDGHGSFRAPVIQALLIAADAALRGVEKAQTISADQKARDAIAAKEIQDRITAQKNWAIARDGVRKLFPKGSTQGANGRPVQPMHPRNYLEVLDPQHRRGDELMKHFMDWERNDLFQGNFWEYLNKLKSDQLDHLQKFKVTYVDSLAFRDLFVVNFEAGLMQSHMSPVVQNMIMSGTPLDKVITNASKKFLDTTTWPSKALKGLSDGWGAFVLSPQDVLYVGVHMGGSFHHSSFLCGAPVLAAGMIKVQQGRVLEIHESNGHYQAQGDHMKSFLTLLKRNMPGTDWAKVSYYKFNTGERTTVAQMLNLQPPQSVAKGGPQPSTVGYSTMQRSGRPLPQPPAQQKGSGRPLPQPPLSPPKGNVRNLANRFNKG